MMDTSKGEKKQMLKIFAEIANLLDRLTEPAPDALARRLGDPPGTTYTPMTLLEVRHLMSTGDFVSDAQLRQMNHAHLQQTVAQGEAGADEAMRMSETAMRETVQHMEAEQHNQTTWTSSGFGGFGDF